MKGEAVRAALKQVLDLVGRAPPPGADPRLAALFRRLAASRSPADAEEIEGGIWALWSERGDARLDGMMSAAGEALMAERWEEARLRLDALVAAAPDWAEAWNKRAILAFIESRDAESTADILRALALEPRHFGALAGFGQICLRQGEPAAALAVFEAALRVHPHLEGVKKAVALLSAGGGGRPN